MEQHPVPQHLASFQFKLFGNLTTRQFMTLALPLTVAGMIYFSPLAAVIRLPMATILALAGAFVALVPVGGRPFDKWLVAFIKAVFAPTQRVWIKETRLPDFLSIVVATQREEDKIPQKITEQGRERLVAYLKSLPRENESPLDVREDMAISQLNLSSEQVGSGIVPPPIIWPTSIEGGSQRYRKVEAQTDFSGKGQKMGKTEAGEKTISPQSMGEPTTAAKVGAKKGEPKVPKIAVHLKPYTLRGVEDRLAGKVVHVPRYPLKPMAHLASETNFATENVISVMEPDMRIRLVKGVGETRVRKLHFAPPENFDLSELPIRGERRFEISEELKRRFQFEDESPVVLLPDESKLTVSSVGFEVAAGNEVSKILPKQARQVAAHTQEKAQPVLVKEEGMVEDKQEAKFAITDRKQQDAPQPMGVSAQIIPLTDTPNVISGLVADADGVPVEGAVLVVRDLSGLPVRALKTSKLGQFLSATPLAAGGYTIEIESERAAFKPTAINISGQVLQPLGIYGEAVSK